MAWGSETTSWLTRQLGNGREADMAKRQSTQRSIVERVCTTEWRTWLPEPAVLVLVPRGILHTAAALSVVTDPLTLPADGAPDPTRQDA